MLGHANYDAFASQDDMLYKNFSDQTLIQLGVKCMHLLLHNGYVHQFKTFNKLLTWRSSIGSLNMNGFLVKT